LFAGAFQFHRANEEHCVHVKGSRKLYPCFRPARIAARGVAGTVCSVHFLQPEAALVPPNGDGMTLGFTVGNDFPLATDSPEVAQQKKARLMGRAAPTPEKISDAPPPQVVNKALTGRIPQKWKGNGK
jgi:hypothetical protein